MQNVYISIKCAGPGLAGSATVSNLVPARITRRAGPQQELTFFFYFLKISKFSRKMTFSKNLDPIELLRDLGISTFC